MNTIIPTETEINEIIDQDSTKSFDFAELDITEMATQGAKFPILDIRTAEPIPGCFAVMLGPQSPEFRKATHKIDAGVTAARMNPKANEFEVREQLTLERAVLCTKELIGCESRGKKITKDKNDIREFYKRYGFVWEQLDRRITSRSNFLPDAGEVGSDTSGTTLG